MTTTDALRGHTSTHPITVTLVTEVCCNCHVVFGIEAGHQADLRRTKAQFFCPNGHGQHYLGETHEQQLRRLKDAATQALLERDAAQSNLAAANRKAQRQAQQLRAMRKRVAAGVCPVPGCTRSGFTQVSRHIKAQHPDFYAEHSHELDA